MDILIGKVEAIVREAAKIFKERSFEIKYKEGFENIVTSADIKVQQFLCEQLRNLIPDCGFICEEEDVCYSQDGMFVWVIDPIDGTTNYARGISECCISVALMKNSEVVLGVVYNPMKDEMFTAIKGGGASLNGETIGVSQRGFNDGILCTAMCVYEKRYAKLCSDIICHLLLPRSLSGSAFVPIISLNHASWSLDIVTGGVFVIGSFNFSDHKNEYCNIVDIGAVLIIPN